MKVRNGFVSNSSSSSFIIIQKTKEKINKEDIIKNFLINEIGYDDEELFEELKENILEKTKNISGFKLIYRSLEYGTEEEVLSILDELDVPYIIME